MNHNYSNNTDILYEKLLNWLQQQSIPDFSSLEMEQEIDPLDWEEDLDMIPTNLSNVVPHDPLSAMEQIPNLQSRFQALLKQRLQREIQNRPPLFPWESEICEYETDWIDETNSPLVPKLKNLWSPQLASLALPLSIPQPVLNALLQACSEAMLLGQPQGAKLVRAVTALFPNQFHSLNQLAGLVLVSPVRSAQTSPDYNAVLSTDYETATVEQQMALSLLSAREIIDYLTLTLSQMQPNQTRQWQTTAGLVQLQASYQQSALGSGGIANQTVQVKAWLPKGGRLTLQSPQASTSAERTYPGEVCVELIHGDDESAYSIEIDLLEPDSIPLNFAVVVSH